MTPRYVRKIDGEPVEAMTWRGDNLLELRAFAGVDPAAVEGEPPRVTVSGTEVRPAD